MALGNGDGDDEPAVLGNDVGDYKVNFLGLIRNQASMCAPVAIDMVAAVTKRGRAFNLDAPEAMSGFEDEVVALAVAVRAWPRENPGWRLCKRTPVRKVLRGAWWSVRARGQSLAPGSGIGPRPCFFYFA